MVRLERPCLALIESYLEFIDEMRRLGEQIWESTTLRKFEKPEEFVSRLMSAEVSPPPPLIPESTYWAVIE